MLKSVKTFEFHFCPYFFFQIHHRYHLNFDLSRDLLPKSSNVRVDLGETPNANCRLINMEDSQEVWGSVANLAEVAAVGATFADFYFCCCCRIVVLGRPEGLFLC